MFLFTLEFWFWTAVIFGGAWLVLAMLASETFWSIVAALLAAAVFVAVGLGVYLLWNGGRETALIAGLALGAAVVGLFVASLRATGRVVLGRLVVILFCLLMFVASLVAGIERGTPLIYAPLWVLLTAIIAFFSVSIAGALKKQ